MRGNPTGPRGRPTTSLEQPAAVLNVANSLIDSVAANSAILDDKGIIRLTNRAWRQFARAHNMKYPDGIGVNYLALADAVRGYSSERAQEASSGIRSLLRGGSPEFVMEYPCHSVEEERWFRMRASLLEGLGSLRVVVLHQNISREKHTEQRLDTVTQQLRVQEANFETVKNALKFLLERRDQDEREMEEKILANISALINPYLEKLRRTYLNAEQRHYLDIISTNLHGVIAPFLYRLSSTHLNLTSQEINVANLILEGKSTKDIAESLSISSNAVEFHRKNIRRKLGIRNKKVGLRSRLISLEPSCVYQQFHAWRAATGRVDDDHPDGRE